MSNNDQNNDSNKTNKTQDSGNSRRAFFKKIGLASAAAAAGGAAIYSGYRYEETKPNHDFVKALTTDNKLVEVRRDQIKDIKLDLTELQRKGREGLKGHRLFSTPQEVDQYLQEERNAWDN